MNEIHELLDMIRNDRNLRAVQLKILVALLALPKRWTIGELASELGYSPGWIRSSIWLLTANKVVTKDISQKPYTYRI